MPEVGFQRHAIDNESLRWLRHQKEAGTCAISLFNVMRTRSRRKPMRERGATQTIRKRRTFGDTRKSKIQK